MKSILQDLRFSFRALQSAPGFSLLAISTLAAGLACTTAAFCWIERTLLWPIPGSSNPETLVGIESVMPTGNIETVSPVEYLGYRDNLTLVQGVAIANLRPFTLGEGASARRIWGELVSGNLLHTLGVQPHIGRLYRPGEILDRKGDYALAVISHRLWRTEFQSDPALIGKHILVNRHKLLVVGVAAPAFQGTISGVSLDIWIPWTMAVRLGSQNDAAFTWKGSRGWNIFARLKPGATVPQADAEVKAVAARMDAAAPPAVKGVSGLLSPINQLHYGVGAVLREPLWMLLAFSFLVLLIVCSNIANLLLARSMARRREFTIRLSLGSGAWGLVRLLTIETLLLSFAAGALAIPLALWAGDAVGLLLPPTGLPLAVGLEINWRIAAFIFAACVAASVISSIVPAILAFRMNLNDALKDDGKGQSSGRSTHRARSLLVVGEVALASFALVAAGFVYQSFANASRLRLGFDPSGVLLSQLYLSDSSYDLSKTEQFFATLHRRLSEAPGVISAAYADQVPLWVGSHPWHDLVIEGYLPANAAEVQIQRSIVSPRYFDTLRIPILDGRDFTDRDVRKQPDVMIVNQTFAKRFFSGGNPLGRKVRINQRTFTVVGVAADSRIHHPAERPFPYFYLPFQQYFNVGLPTVLYVRTSGGPAGAASIVRREIAAIDSELGGFHCVPLPEYIAAGLMAEKLASGFLSAVALIALLLAAAGLYSVMAYSVAERTRELGIRVALGATPGGVTRLVLRGGLVLSLAGLAIGLAAGIWAATMVQARLVGVDPRDPRTASAVAAFLLAIALLASYIPARRATRIDPVSAMRGD
jgi:predicted permease